MMEQIIVLDKESNVFSKIELNKTINSRNFSMKNTLDFINYQKNIQIKIIDPDNKVILIDKTGKELLFDFDTLVNLQVMLNHLNDFENQNIFSETVLIKA